MTLRFATWHMVIAFIAGFVVPMLFGMGMEDGFPVAARYVFVAMAVVAVGLFVAFLVFYNPVAGGG